MGVVKQMIDDDHLAEQLNRGWDDVCYGEEEHPEEPWPTEQECKDDAEDYG